MTFAGWKNNGGGYQVWIAHGSGLYTTYNHMSAITVGVGQHVSRGTQVGRIGMTGDATGPHLPLRGLARPDLERRDPGQPAGLLLDRRTSRRGAGRRGRALAPALLAHAALRLRSLRCSDTAFAGTVRAPAILGSAFGATEIESTRARMTAMFLDRVKIWVRAGDGGDGAATFRQEAHVPRGGPDGGDGGRGGSVFLRVDAGQTTLRDFNHRHHFRATPGGRGTRARRHGKAGDDLVLDVPPGTAVYDDEIGRAAGGSRRRRPERRWSRAAAAAGSATRTSRRPPTRRPSTPRRASPAPRAGSGSSCG